MAEYIEREALRSKAVYMHGFGNNKYVPLRAIEDAPTADVAPVVHGRWMPTPEYDSCWCSCCKKQYTGFFAAEWNCCPNCGARMDGE